MLTCSELLGPLDQKPHALPSSNFKSRVGGWNGQKCPWLVPLMPGIHRITFSGQSTQSCFLFCKWGL